MIKVLITGGRGFVGRNLAAHLAERKDCELRVFDQDNSMQELQAWLLEADLIYHLAGINRPLDAKEFEIGNAHLTEDICRFISAAKRPPKIVFSCGPIQSAALCSRAQMKARPRCPSSRAT